MGAEPSLLVATPPKLLKVMVVAAVALAKVGGVVIGMSAAKAVAVTFFEPSRLDLASIPEAGVTTLTFQEEPAPNMNATLVLRATASARARCNPFVIDSAALRISEFLIHV